MSVGATRLGLVRFVRVNSPKVQRPRFDRVFSVAAKATPRSGDATEMPTEKVTVASTRIANYALGSKVLPKESGSGDSSPNDPPTQLVLHADWVTCTQ